MAGKLTFLRRALRALLTLLVLTASVTPAVAEIGCFRASFGHETSGRTSAPVICACDTTPGGQQSAPEGAGHCAFSHGEHGFDLPFLAPLGAASAACAGFPRSPAAFSTAAPRDGPERPPQA